MAAAKNRIGKSKMGSVDESRKMWEPELGRTRKADQEDEEAGVQSRQWRTVLDGSSMAERQRPLKKVRSPERSPPIQPSFPQQQQFARSFSIPPPTLFPSDSNSPVLNSSASRILFPFSFQGSSSSNQPIHFPPPPTTTTTQFTANPSPPIFGTPSQNQMISFGQNQQHQQQGTTQFPPFFAAESGQLQQQQRIEFEFWPG